MMVDYRGYGASPGRATEEGIAGDALASFDWLVSQGHNPGRIVVAAQSLGCAPAAQLAAARRPGLVLLISPFTSLPDVAADRLPWLPIRRLPWPRNRFDLAGPLGRARSPLVFVASRADRQVPAQNSRRLAAMLPGARLVELDDRPHEGLLQAAAESGLIGRLVVETLRAAEAPGLPAAQPRRAAM
jgi:uncharacterized protein